MSNEKLKTEDPKKIVEWLRWLIYKTDNEDMLTPKELHDLVFSADVSGVLFKRFNDFYYEDAGGNYFDSVCWFVNAFVDYLKSIESEEEKQKRLEEASFDKFVSIEK